MTYENISKIEDRTETPASTVSTTSDSPPKTSPAPVAACCFCSSPACATACSASSRSEDIISGNFDDPGMLFPLGRLVRPADQRSPHGVQASIPGLPWTCVCTHAVTIFAGSVHRSRQPQYDFRKNHDQDCRDEQCNHQDAGAGIDLDEIDARSRADHKGDHADRWKHQPHRHQHH